MLFSVRLTVSAKTLPLLQERNRGRPSIEDSNVGPHQKRDRGRKTIQDDDNQGHKKRAGRHTREDDDDRKMSAHEKVLYDLRRQLRQSQRENKELREAPMEEQRLTERKRIQEQNLQTEKKAKELRRQLKKKGKDIEKERLRREAEENGKGKKQKATNKNNKAPKQQKVQAARKRGDENDRVIICDEEELFEEEDLVDDGGDDESMVNSANGDSNVVKKIMKGRWQFNQVELYCEWESGLKQWENLEGLLQDWPAMTLRFLKTDRIMFKKGVVRTLSTTMKKLYPKQWKGYDADPNWDRVMDTAEDERDWDETGNVEESIGKADEKEHGVECLETAVQQSDQTETEEDTVQEATVLPPDMTGNDEDTILCDHTLMNLRAEELSSYCKPAQLLFGVICTQCGAKFQSKGASAVTGEEVEKTAVPSRNKPVRFCHNVKLCWFGLCNGCYNVKLTEDVGKTRDSGGVCDDKDDAAVL